MFSAFYLTWAGLNDAGFITNSGGEKLAETALVSRKHKEIKNSNIYTAKSEYPNSKSHPLAIIIFRKPTFLATRTP
jgi:hypothetical protein